MATAIHSDDEVRRLLGDVFGLTYDHHRAIRVRDDRQCDGGRREQFPGPGGGSTLPRRISGAPGCSRRSAVPGLDQVNGQLTPVGLAGAPGKSKLFGRVGINTDHDRRAFWCRHHRLRNDLGTRRRLPALSPASQALTVRGKARRATAGQSGTLGCPSRGATVTCGSAQERMGRKRVQRLGNAARPVPGPSGRPVRYRAVRGPDASVVPTGHPLPPPGFSMTGCATAGSRSREQRRR